SGATAAFPAVVAYLIGSREVGSERPFSRQNRLRICCENRQTSRTERAGHGGRPASAYHPDRGDRYGISLDRSDRSGDPTLRPRVQRAGGGPTPDPRQGFRGRPQRRDVRQGARQRPAVVPVLLHGTFVRIAKAHEVALVGFFAAVRRETRWAAANGAGLPNS